MQPFGTLPGTEADRAIFGSIPEAYHKEVSAYSLLPEVPDLLTETSATVLEWPRLREYIASAARSPLGRAWTLALEPSSNLSWIDEQQQRTAEMQAFLNGGGSFEFRGLFDPTPLLEKARVDGVAIEALELLAMLTVAERVAAWRSLVLPSPTSAPRSWPGIFSLSEPLLDHDLAPLLRMLRGKIEPDGSLSDDASPELKRIRRAMERQHRAIEESLRRSLRSVSEAGSAQDEVITIRGDRFVIPVKAEFRRRVPGVIHGTSSSGQTVFVEPLETIEQNNELVRLLEEELQEIHRILVAMTRALATHAEAIAIGCSLLAEIESHTVRARFANSFNCVRPTFTVELSLSGARHPLLELRMRQTLDGLVQPIGGAGIDSSSIPRGTDAASPATDEESLREDDAGTPLNTTANRARTPVPLTLGLSENARELIISGPNTGGKTVSLKTLGLLAIAAQSGIPVPAEAATFPLFRAVYADIGDAQSIERNLSSFSAHIVNVNAISRAADENSLVLLDELGSATDPEEGAALAVAIAGHFLRRRAWTCITTHLTSLKVYAANHPGVLNAAVGFDQATLAPTYALRMGVPGASAGLNIAARLGLDPAIVTEARSQMTTQTADIGSFLDQLHKQLAEATNEREHLRRREAELTRDRQRLDLEGKAEQKQRTRELEAKLEALIKDFEAQLRETVKAIDDKSVASRIARDSALRTARLRREFSDQFKSTVVAHSNGADRTDPNATRSALRHRQPQEIKAGDLVTLRSLGGREAQVLHVVDDRHIEVGFGQTKMKSRVTRDDVLEITKIKAVTPLEAARRRGGVTIQTVESSDSLGLELNVIGRTADEAQDEVARYVDRAFLAGLPRVRIVHGTGMGVLRRTIREFLKQHPHVTGVTEPGQNEGGQGATVVELRQ